MCKHPLSGSGGTGPMRAVAVAFLLASVSAWAAPEELEGQRPGRDSGIEATPDLFERPTEISPRSGPPGTVVTVRGIHLPAITPVNIAFGGTRSGFEGLAFILTSREGVVEEHLEVPEWADRERIHRFIIFDAYFDPISMTELFHVTDEDGLVLRDVEVTEAGSTCAVVAGADQDAYYLLGETGDFSVGDQMTVEGRVVDSGDCGEGSHLEIHSVNNRR